MPTREPRYFSKSAFWLGGALLGLAALSLQYVLALDSVHPLMTSPGAPIAALLAGWLVLGGALASLGRYSWFFVWLAVIAFAVGHIVALQLTDLAVINAKRGQRLGSIRPDVWQSSVIALSGMFGFAALVSSLFAWLAHPKT